MVFNVFLAMGVIEEGLAADKGNKCDYREMKSLQYQTAKMMAFLWHTERHMLNMSRGFL